MYAHNWWLGLLLVTGIVSSRTTDFNIQGTTANGWEFVRELFQENFVLERDLGGSIAVYHHGDLVVDLQGGWFDRAQVQPYDSNTLQLVFSTTKGLTAIAVALCVQRGLLDYSALVTQYWPEYGQNGKENTTVSDIMAHRAGLPLDSATSEQHLNWATMINILEAQQPSWPPGTQHGYHALTYGWLAGELVRRVDPLKRTLGQFIRDEIARPLDLEFYIGLPAELEYRVSPLDYNSTGNASGMVSYDVFNDPRLHQAELPAANGITNARSLARLYASCLSDIDKDKYRRILSKDVLDMATKLNTPDGELDAVLHIPTQFAMGFSYFDQIFSSFGKGVFGHNGVGGSIGFAAPEKKFVFAYVMNQMGAEIAVEIDPRYKTILDRIATKLNSSSAALRHSFTMLTSTLSVIMLLKKFMTN